MIKLKRLKINRYRNVEPCELVFSDRFNILLGPNGAGKTTLLNLISKVLRTNLGDTTDPFSIEVELSFPGGTVSGKIETFDETRERQHELPLEWRPSFAARLGSSQTNQTPLLDLRVSRDDSPSIVTISRMDEGITYALDGEPRHEGWFERLAETSSLLAYAVGLANATHGRRDSDIHDETQNVSRFDESLDTFRSITARQGDTGLINNELQPILMYAKFAEKGTTSPWNTVFTEGMCSQRLRRLFNQRFAEGITDMSFLDGDLLFLSETVRLLGLRSSTAELQLTGKSTQSPGSEFYRFSNLRFLFTRKDGSIFQDQHLSYGQKRLLTFLYYLEANPSIVIADELVNGLHHAWIKECMEAIGERQAFLTSQNPLLLDYLFFESVEQVKGSFILCRTEPVGDSEKMIWRNLTDDEAAMFYSAYKVGIEHVGEILRTRGLW